MPTTYFFSFCNFSLLFMYRQKHRFYMYLCILFLKLIFSSNISAPTWVFFSSNIPLSRIFQSWKLFYFQVSFSRFFLQSLFHFRVFFHRKYLLSLVYFPSSIFFLHSFYSFTLFTLDIIYSIKCFLSEKLSFPSVSPENYLFPSENFPCWSFLQ